VNLRANVYKNRAFIAVLTTDGNVTIVNDQYEKEATWGSNRISSCNDMKRKKVVTYDLFFFSNME
jgi:hypothetical protein